MKGGNTRSRALYYANGDSRGQNAIKMRAFLNAVMEEYQKAREHHPSTPNGHSGYAVMLEEVEEVWQEVKHPTVYENLFGECVQTAAMAMAMAIELE